MSLQEIEFTSANGRDTIQAWVYEPIFVDLYDQVNSDDWYKQLPADLAVLILAGDQDPVTNYGEGAYHVANRLADSGHEDVRTRVFPGVRHEVHNEPTTRAETERETVEFIQRVAHQRQDSPTPSAAG